MKQLDAVVNMLLDKATFTDVNNTRSTFLNVATELIPQILFLEKKEDRQKILISLRPLREKISESPFLKRTQEWPRGYAGDFETIMYMIDGKNRAPISTIGYIAEDFFLNSDIVKQHKNKLEVQMKMIEEGINKKGKINILSIGCGTSEDVYQMRKNIKMSNSSVTLLDIDRDALAYSITRLSDIANNIEAICGNIYKLIYKLKNKYDLIIIGGVFDYLKDKMIHNILRSLYCNNLSQQGAIFFTNIKKGNPFRIFMEYLSDWILIERDENIILSFVEDLPKLEAIKLYTESTNLTYLVELQKE